MNNLPPPVPFITSPYGGQGYSSLPPPPPPIPTTWHTDPVTGISTPMASHSIRGGRRGRHRFASPVDYPMRAHGQVVEDDLDTSEESSEEGEDESEEGGGDGDGKNDGDEKAAGDAAKPKSKKKKRSALNGTDATEPQPPEGSLLEVKRVDEIFDRKTSEWVTRDSRSSKKKKKAGEDKYAPYAFLVHRKFNPTPDPTLHMITTTIDVRSEWIRKVGVEVIGQVQGITWTAKPLRIEPQVFLAWLPDLLKHQEKLSALPNPTDDEKQQLAHLSHLTNFFQTSPDHVETLASLRALLSHSEITFEYLWAILLPRTVLYTRCAITGAPRAVKLVHAEQCNRGQAVYWRLDVEYVDYNVDADDDGAPSGPRFGLASLPGLEIPSFKGAAKISSLPVYPVKYYRGWDDLKKRIIERGRKWVALQGVHHRHYNATGYHWKDGKYIKLNTNSRIMVDFKTFQQTMPNYEFPIVNKTLTGDDVDKHQYVFEGPEDAQESNGASEESNSPEPAKANRDVLSDDDLTLTSPIVYGFSLADKLWLEFNVEHVNTFTWNDEPFKNLVLARDQKSLIQSLVEAHISSSNNGGKGGSGGVFDDFVEGKGRGLVINLFGNPGVGKSLTAEATSEHVRKPLYVVGAGDLGTSAALLDANLTRIFNISANWGAVVLIDEADVFLEERSFHDLERNAMVAVFLRQLEYFTGILFLTTNRVRTFDEAFQSRIHVALRYHDLASDAKRQIWVAFLKKAHAVGAAKGLPAPGNGADDREGLTYEQLHELGEKKVNGRQIKNVVRTASALANNRQEVVGYKHLIQVLDMMEQFEMSNAMYQ